MAIGPELSRELNGASPRVSGPDVPRPIILDKVISGTETTIPLTPEERAKIRKEIVDPTVPPVVADVLIQHALRSKIVGWGFVLASTDNTNVKLEVHQKSPDLDTVRLMKIFREYRAHHLRPTVQARDVLAGRIANIEKSDPQQYILMAPALRVFESTFPTVKALKMTDDERLREW